MQRTWANGCKRVIFYVLPVVVLAILILLDQLTKVYFKNLYLDKGNTTVIDGFFSFTYTVNTGAAWSFLSDVEWAQTFFKILTGFALVVFGAFYVYSLKKGYKWLQYSIIFIVGGTIGNFIDRLSFNGVTDFLSFTFGTYNFPVFNLADSFLTVGVIMLIIHYLFLDKEAIFKRKPIGQDNDLSVKSDEDCVKENED